MADQTSQPVQQRPNNNTPRRERFGRDRLAQVVVVGSFLTLFLLIAGMLAIAQLSTANSNATNMAEKTFNTILPVLAAWVGTVLAFYFSAQSLERTHETLDQTIAKAVGTVSDVTVAEKMIPAMAIRVPIDLSKEKPENIKLGDLRERYNKPPDGGPPVTRMVFWENGVLRYLMHLSVLNSFLVRQTAAGKTESQLSFADMLQDKDVVTQIMKVAFVKPSVTLTQARDALNSVPGAQDIIVTATGDASGPMLGWLTNVDLTKILGT